MCELIDKSRHVTFPLCTFGVFSCSGEGASPIKISLWQVSQNTTHPVLLLP